MKTQPETRTRSYGEVMQDHQWLAVHGLEIQRKYQGEWIAINDGRVIAHDKDFDQVTAVAQQLRVDPLYTQIPEEATIIYDRR